MFSNGQTTHQARRQNVKDKLHWKAIAFDERERITSSSRIQKNKIRTHETHCTTPRHTKALQRKKNYANIHFRQPAALVPGEESGMKAKPGPGQGWKGFMASIEIDTYPFRYIVIMSHDFAKIPALIIMFAIDMFHQIRKFAKTTQVANRGTI